MGLPGDAKPGFDGFPICVPTAIGNIRVACEHEPRRGVGIARALLSRREERQFVLNVLGRGLRFPSHAHIDGEIRLEFNAVLSESCEFDGMQTVIFATGLIERTHIAE